MKKLKFLLQIKRWKLFCLFLSSFLLSWIPFVETYILPLIFVVWFSWLVSIGYNGQDYLRNVTIKWLTKRKFFFRVCFLIILFFGSFFFLNQKRIETDSNLYYLIVLFSIIEGYCFFYILIATAVVITTLEHRSKAEFWKTFGHFMRLIFFPLGVYGIQEIVNREFDELY